MVTQDIRLELTPEGVGSRVWVAGREIRNVMSLRLTVSPDSPPLLEITVLVNAQTIDATGEVVVQEQP